MLGKVSIVHRSLSAMISSAFSASVSVSEEEEVIENFNSDIYIINDIKKWLYSE
jgi:hypothetical protein